jgi:cytochrome P450
MSAKVLVTDILKIGHSPLLHIWVWLKPLGLDVLLQATAPKNITDYYEFLDTHVKERIDQEDLIASHNEGDEKGVRHDLFHYLYASKNPETGRPSFTHTQLRAEASLLVIAGADTTAAAMSGILYHLTRNERVYNKLVAEILSTFDSVDEIRGGTKLSSCHYLRACILEALRINPSGLTEPPREVLKGGLLIDGRFVPESTTVGCAAWATFHNEECYADPWAYRPERWIVDPETGITGDDVAKAHSSFQPFLTGTGNCVGQKIAMLELLIFVGRTLWRMDVRSADMGVEAKKDLGWGRRHKDVLEVKDAYVTLHDGPMVQFRNRSVE